MRAGESEKNEGLTDVNVYISQIEEAGGVDKIEDLQTHENLQVYDKAVKILDNYLAQDDEDEMLATSDTPQTEFGFSTDQLQKVSSAGFNFKQKDV